MGHGGCASPQERVGENEAGGSLELSNELIGAQQGMDGDKSGRRVEGNRFDSIMKGRAQVEMWMLTKFAMLFFIVGLFAIIFVFEQNARSESCKAQAQKIAFGIENRIAQILESPVEDEQRAFVFELGIPLGKDDVTRYTVNLTKRELKGETDTGVLQIAVIPEGVKNCEGSARIGYAKKKVRMFSERSEEWETSQYRFELVQLNPSDRDADLRSYFLVAIKCSEKAFGGQKYLFLQDCTQNDPGRCFSFETADVDGVCGFV